jgi:hypothetical protein
MMHTWALDVNKLNTYLVGTMYLNERSILNKGKQASGMASNLNPKSDHQDTLSFV